MSQIMSVTREKDEQAASKGMISGRLLVKIAITCFFVSLGAFVLAKLGIAWAGIVMALAITIEVIVVFTWNLALLAGRLKNDLDEL